MRTEKELDFLEKHIPNLANSAVQKAYLDTLSQGSSVVEAINGELVEIYPDGTKVVLKTLEKEVKVGKKIIRK